MTRLDFEIPEYLYLVLLVIPLGFLFWLFRNWRKKRLKSLGSDKRLNYLLGSFSIRRMMLKASLILAAFYLFVVSLANPRLGYEVEEVERKGLDIVFALDISKSMLCEDVVPNRIERAKQLIRNILSELSTDRIGLVVYAGSAFPQMPITTDYTMAMMLLDHINTNMVSSQGTALSEALELCEDFFEDQLGAAKVVIVLSDGEDHEEGAKEIAERMRDNKFSIYTVGIGTKSGAPIPQKRGERLIGYKKDSNGKVVITKLDESQLIEIAGVGKGEYYDLSKSSARLSNLMSDLNSLERKSYDSTELKNYKDQFQWFLALGLILIFMEEILPLRRIFTRSKSSA